MNLGRKLTRSALAMSNRLLSPAHIELTKTWERRARPFAEYISLEPTVRSARALGMSVGDYIDWQYNVPGATEEAISKLVKMGALSEQIETVCEVGPGSGRYLERVQSICRPRHYEIYETSSEWEQWLVEQFNVSARHADGLALRETEADSIDLVHANKVFPGLSILAVCSYLDDMSRVLRSGGKMFFDVLTESCLTDDLLSAWWQSGVTFPCSMISSEFVADFLSRRGVEFMGEFLSPMKPAVTNVLVFSTR
jgi:hypothetical protein